MIFGRSVAYCTQTVQVLAILCVPAVDDLRGSQSAAIRDDIPFGVPHDGEHYQSAVCDCCLLPGFEFFRQVHCPSVPTATYVDDLPRGGGLT